MWGNGKWFVLVAGGGGECAGVGERVREWTQAAITEIRGVRLVRAYCSPTLAAESRQGWCTHSGGGARDAGPSATVGMTRFRWLEGLHLHPSHRGAVTGHPWLWLSVEGGFAITHRAGFAVDDGAPGFAAAENPCLKARHGATALVGVRLVVRRGRCGR
jgi:hypothetical protein